MYPRFERRQDGVSTVLEPSWHSLMITGTVIVLGPVLGLLVISRPLVGVGLSVVGMMMAVALSSHQRHHRSSARASETPGKRRTSGLKPTVEIGPTKSDGPRS